MDIIDKIYDFYYKEIMNYCYVRLNFNQNAAEDCTQEVFLALYKKRKKINLHTNIRAWLYKAADIEVKKYIRKNPLSEDIDEYDVPFEEQFSDNASINLKDVLNTEELNFAEEYYSGENKELIADKYNMSLNALYSKIKRIKKKLQKFIENKQ